MKSTAALRTEFARIRATSSLTREAFSAACWKRAHHEDGDGEEPTPEDWVAIASTVAHYGE